METISNYLFWVSIYLVITGFIYWLLVSRSGTPSQNRGFILTGLFCSLILGAVGLISLFDFSQSSAITVVLLPEIVVGTSAALNSTGNEMLSAISTIDLLLYIIIGISIVLALRMFISVLILIINIRLKKSLNINDCKVIPVRRIISPFSFFGYVFVPENILSNEDCKTILLHEKVHIRRRHSLDLIFIELLTLIFWFHPAIWYLRKELKLQHEYEADNYVLKQEVDKTHYQKILLAMTVGGMPISIINPFSYSPLKKRIMKMNQKFSSSRLRAIIGMLAIIPLFGLVLLFQACEEKPTKEEIAREQIMEFILTEMEKEKTRSDIHGRLEQAETDEIFPIVDEVPDFEGGMGVMSEWLSENLRYPEISRANGDQGTVYIAFVVNKDGSVSDIEVIRGVSPELDDEAIRVVKQMPDWKPGILDGKYVNTQVNLPIRFQLQ